MNAINHEKTENRGLILWPVPQPRDNFLTRKNVNVPVIKIGLNFPIFGVK